MLPFSMMVCWKSGYLLPDNAVQQARVLNLQAPIWDQLNEGRTFLRGSRIRSGAGWRSYPPQHKQGVTIFFWAFGFRQVTIANVLLQISETGGRPVPFSTETGPGIFLRTRILQSIAASASGSWVCGVGS
jgi:hypothetical protein